VELTNESHIAEGVYLMDERLKKRDYPSINILSAQMWPATGLSAGHRRLGRCFWRGSGSSRCSGSHWRWW